MKHIPLLCLLICSLAFSQDDAKQESPLEGWKVVTGTWVKAKKGIATNKGTLQWEGEIGKRIQIDFYLTVRKWADGRFQLAGIIWNAGDMVSGGGNPAKPRNLALIRGQGTIGICSQPERPNIPRKDTRYTLPLGKPTRVRAIITKRRITLMVGKQKASADVPSEDLGKLQLHVNGADAVFTKIKVKAK